MGFFTSGKAKAKIKDDSDSEPDHAASSDEEKVTHALLLNRLPKRSPMGVSRNQHEYNI
jgi:hypothetical protein